MMGYFQGRRAAVATLLLVSLLAGCVSQATPAPAPVAAAPTAAEPSFLTVGTRPWTTVVLDGKSLGSTPLYKVSIPAGRHTLLLHNDDEGIRQTSVIDVRPGETKKLDLTLKPK